MDTSVEAVIFDCFGVLTTDMWLAFIDNLPDGVDIGAARKLNHAFDAGIITEEEFLDGVKKVTGQQPHVLEKFKGEVVKNEVLLDYIRELRKRDYKIGLLSNVATNWIRDAFLTAEEQELFDEMIFSFEVGMTKPDPRIFMLACERLRVGPHETVFIDDIGRYCAAASAEGLQTINYQDFKQMKSELEEILSQKN